MSKHRRPTHQIPSKPKSVAALEAEMADQKNAAVFAACRVVAWGGHFPLFRAPEILGQQLADNLMDQVMEQMAARQKLAAPSGIMVPR